MKGETAVDTEELVFDVLSLEGGKSLAIWAKREKLAENIRIMTERGMEPEIVTAALFSWNTLLPATADKAPAALTDGEAVAVYNNGLPVYFRPLGPGEMVNEVVKTLAALEIAKGIKLDHLFLHGSAARQAMAVPYDAPEGISFSVLPVTGELAATFPSDSAAALDLAGAFALAKACRSAEPVDFRRGDLVYTAGFAKTRKKLRLTMYLAAAVVFLLCVEGRSPLLPRYAGPQLAQQFHQIHLPRSFPHQEEIGR